VDIVLVEAEHLVGRTALLRRVPDTDGLDAEAVESGGDFLSDGAQSDDGDGRSGELVGLEVAPLVVFLASPRLVEVPGEHEQVPDGLLGDTGRGYRPRS